LYVTSILFLLILPFIISLAIVTILSKAQGPFFGFSGIVAAYMCYFIYVVYNFIYTHYIKNINMNFIKKYYINKLEMSLFALLILINFLFMISNISSAPFTITIGLLILITITFIINIPVIIKVVQMLIPKAIDIYVIKSINVNNLWRTFYITLIFLFTLVNIISLPSLIPADIHTQNGTIDILGHYVGYAFTIILCMVYIYLDSATNRKKQISQNVVT
jgi:hypothetical protein